MPTIYTILGSILMAVFLVNYYITGIPHMVALLFGMFFIVMSRLDKK